METAARSPLPPPPARSSSTQPNPNHHEHEREQGESKDRCRQSGGMNSQSSPVVLLHLRRLDRFFKRQGLHSIAHTLERESMVYFDAAHLQKLVKDGQWEAAGTYLKGFSPLWEGEGTTQHYTSFLHNVQHRAMLAFLACRGEEGGRAASSLFWSNDDAFRKKFPKIAERTDLYRSMASAQARASVNWEDIKLRTLEELQELLHLHPDVKCSLRMRELQCTPTASEITPLGSRVSWRHQRKRVERKPASELARFLLQKKKRLPSSQQTNQPGDSGVPSAPMLETMLPTSERPTKIISIAPNINAGMKHSRPYDAHFPESFEQAFDSQKGAKRLRTTGEFAEEAKEDVLVHCSLEMRKPFLLPSETRDASA